MLISTAMKYFDSEFRDGKAMQMTHGVVKSLGGAKNSSGEVR
jgi:hypothetical protein